MRSLNLVLIGVVLCLEGTHLSALCCEKTVYLPWLCAHHNPHASYAYWISSDGESGWKQERPSTFPFPLITFLMAVFEAWNLCRIWTAFLKEELMESNRGCRDFAVNTTGEGMELFHCISPAFAEAGRSFWKNGAILPKSAWYHMQMNCLTVFSASINRFQRLNRMKTWSRCCSELELMLMLQTLYVSLYNCQCGLYACNNTKPRLANLATQFCFQNKIRDWNDGDVPGT